MDEKTLKYFCMEEVPKVSVVITCYNLGRYLYEAVDSVLKQTIKQVEIIVIDDGSTDKMTIDVLDEMRHQKISVVRTENQGLCSARNTGITLARAKYICCLDADDKLDKGYLEEVCSVLDGDYDKNLGFVTTWAMLFGNVHTVWKTRDYNPILLAINNVVTVASVFRKEAWLMVGGYNVNMREGYEDWNFWLSIVAKGYRWTVIQKPLFWYRVRPNSMISKSVMIHKRLFDRIMENNRDFYKENRDAIIQTVEEMRKDRSMYEILKYKVLKIFYPQREILPGYNNALLVEKKFSGHLHIYS